MLRKDSSSEVWRSQGFLTGLDIFSEHEIAGYRSLFDELEVDNGQGKAEIGLHNRHITNEFVWTMSTHPRFSNRCGPFWATISFS